MPKKRPTPTPATREPASDLEQLAVQAFARESDLAARRDEIYREMSRHLNQAATLAREHEAVCREAAEQYGTAIRIADEQAREAAASLHLADRAINGVIALRAVFPKLFGEPPGNVVEDIEAYLPPDVQNAIREEERAAAEREEAEAKRRRRAGREVTRA